MAAEVKQASGHYPTIYAECRTAYGHRWDRIGAVEAGKQRDTWRVHMQCDRCGMRKRLVVNGKGEITSRTYVQPVGYRITKENYDRAALRRAVVLSWKGRKP